MVRPEVHRFEIWLVQLDPTQGSEINKTRPCVVISPDEISALNTALIAPMTSKGFSFPTRISCIFQNKTGMILLDQIRSVDKSRLLKKVGTISKGTQIKMIACLQDLFSF